MPLIKIGRPNAWAGKDSGTLRAIRPAHVSKPANADHVRSEGAAMGDCLSEGAPIGFLAADTLASNGTD